jgi:hypothetical protein
MVLMGVVYVQPSRPSRRSPEDRKREEERSRKAEEERRRREEERRARERNQRRVRWVFIPASIIVMTILVFPLFTVVGFWASVGTGAVLAGIMAVSYLAVNRIAHMRPTLGLLVSAGVVGAVAFVGTAAIHAFFPRTLPPIDVAASTTTGANIEKVDSICKSQYAQDSTVIYPCLVENRFFFYVSDGLRTRKVEIPQNEFMSFAERLWQNLGGNVDLDLAERLGMRAKNLAGIVSKEGLASSSETVLVLDGDVPNVNFQQVFPDKLVFRSVSMDEGLIINHLEELYNAPPFDPEDTVVINGIPSNASELGQAKLQEGEWEQWEGIYQAWNNAAKRNGFAVSGNTAQEALNAFETSTNILIIVAHSDGYSIFFPDGSSLSTDDLSDAQDSIGRNKPLVALFSCETAKVDENLASFAKKLVDLGAKAVVAPVSTIGARSSSALFEDFLKASVEGLSPVEALQRAVRETSNTSLETWIGMLAEPEERNVR